MSSEDPLHALVEHLLSKSYDLPCSTAAQAFSQLTQPNSSFQAALDVLLPLIDTPGKLTERILVSFILYSLYAPYPIAINPFKSVLYDTFVKERNHAIKLGSYGSASDNEQLVWVLWKILRGEGNDIGPYSPATLARSPLPPELRAGSLTLYGKSENDLSVTIGISDENTAHPGDTAPQASDAQVTAEQDDNNETIARAMELLLAARERVLTLSEQRVLCPLIPQLTSPPMITSLDLLPIISNNPTLAQPILVALLTAPQPKLAGGTKGLSTYLEVLKHLPPTLPSFDLLGQLLRDPTPITDFATGGRTTITDMIRTDVLGRFVHESINWLEKAERDENEGLISDDRFSKGVRNLCRFYSSLIRYSIVDPASDIDSVEMAHFSLRNARFEEANTLYRIICQGKS